MSDNKRLYIDEFSIFLLPTNQSSKNEIPVTVYLLSDMIIVAKDDKKNTYI